MNAPRNGEGRPQLTPQQVNDILKADLANLVRKVTSGRTLTQSERKVLEAGGEEVADSGARWASSQVELATILGVDRKTIRRMRARSGCPGCRSDGRYPVEQWRRWLTGLGTLENDPSGDIARLRGENSRLQIKKLQHQADALAGDFMSVTEVKAEWVKLRATAAKVMNRLPKRIAQRIVGLGVTEAEQVMHEEIFAALSELSRDPCGIQPKRRRAR